MPLRKPAIARCFAFAHVTNQMGRIEGDFERGVADGAEESIRVITLTAASWRAESYKPSISMSARYRAGLPPNGCDQNR